MKELRAAEIEYQAGDPPEESGGNGPKEFDSLLLALADSNTLDEGAIVLIDGDPHKWFKGEFKPLVETMKSYGNTTGLGTYQGRFQPTDSVPFKGPFQDPA